MCISINVGVKATLPSCLTISSLVIARVAQSHVGSGDDFVVEIAVIARSSNSEMTFYSKMMFRYYGIREFR